MANTFALSFKAVHSRLASPGAWYKFDLHTFTYTNPTSDAVLLAILNASNQNAMVQICEIAPPAAGNVVGGSGTILLDVDDQHIVLAGQVAGTFALSGLPDGFIILTATLHLQLDGFIPDTNNVLYNALRGGFSIQNIGAPGSNNPIDVPITSSLTSLLLFTDSFGISVDTTPLAGLSPRTTAMFTSMSITGTYAILNFTSTLEIPEIPVQPGDLITITSDPNDLNHVKLNQLTEIDIVSDDPAVTLTVKVTQILTQTEFLLQFIMPTFSGKKPKVIEIDLIGNGVQFSGSVNAGTLNTIWFNDASGIYVLTIGQVVDTLYNRTLIFSSTKPKNELNLLFEPSVTDYKTYYLIDTSLSNVIINDIYGKLELDSDDTSDDFDFLVSSSIDVIGSIDENILDPSVTTGFVP